MKHFGVLRRLMVVLLVLAFALPLMPASAPSAAAASATYRALLIGNNAYIQNPLRGCINDARALKLALESSTKQNYAKRSLMTDLKGAELEKAFAQLSSWGIGSDDVTLIYYSGHGYRNATTGDTGIVGTDLKKISYTAIEKALSKIDGTIVLLLDCCYSGGAIGKSTSDTATSASEIKRYNQGVAQVFQGSSGVNAKAMTGSKYHVITAASGKQYSYESGGFGYFTTGLTEALGWNCVAGKQISSLPGDANADGKVSVAEAYKYARDVVSDFRSVGDQDVQITPANSTLALVQRTASTSESDPVDDSISLSGLPNPPSAVLAPGQGLQMNNVQSLTWSSTNASVASISTSGLVSAKKNGKAQLVGKKNGKVVARCNLDVVNLSKVVRSIGVSETSLSARAGRTIRLNARVNPSAALKKSVKWYSSDTSVATVSASGVVTLKKEGSAKIHCIASSGLSDSCVVNVTPALVTRVLMKRPKASVKVGKKLQLQAKAMPTQAGNRKLQWESTNSTIVEVDPDTGIISGIAPGKAYITATATDGSFRSAKCLVQVFPKS